MLVVQDTTSLNFTELHSIPELGPIDSGELARCVHLHTALGVITSGLAIGILDQQYWARPQKGQPAPEEKESGKWIKWRRCSSRRAVCGDWGPAAAATDPRDGSRRGCL